MVSRLATSAGQAPDRQTALEDSPLGEGSGESRDAGRARTPGPVPVEGSALDLVGLMSAMQETAYLWDLGTDRIAWESNAAEVLGVGTETISTAKEPERREPASRP